MLNPYLNGNIVSYRLATYLLFLLMSINLSPKAQHQYLSDCFKGGVVGDGYTAWYNGGVGTIQLPIPAGCTVKKAYFFSNIYKWQNNMIPALDKTIEINGQSLLLSESYQIGGQFYFSPIQDSVSVIAIDITSFINPNDTIYTINPNNTGQSPVQTPIFSDFYILVLYENPTFDNTCIEILINTQNSAPTINYSINPANILSQTNNLGLSIHSSSICDDNNDWFEVFINNISIGEIGGQEDNTTISCAGVIGSFEYQNGIITGIGNDVGNNTMQGKDAIADISTYYFQNNNIDIRFEYVSNLSPFSNQINQIFLTYTTPCDTFSTSLTDNIDVCKGAQAQLNATGGASTPLSHPAYEWLPQVGLSCYNCPNPIVTADTINHYTCRIWSTDSCSKVLPVKINILPLPTMPTIAVNPTLCSGNTGHIHITNQPAAYTYTLDGGTPQTTLHFTNLSAGNHLLTIQAVNGCSIDTLLTVAEVNNVVSQFTASPPSGDVPLTVTLTNQSQNATDYIWYIGNDTLYTSSPAPFTHVFDTALTLPLTLISYNTFPQCSDTAQVTIVAEYPFTIIAPSLYVSDENYTPYQIYTSGVKELHYELFTDQGKLVYNKVLLPTNGNLSLWNSNQLAKGIYLYRIWAMDDDGVEKVITGKVVVI